ncbi:hypothetical protein GCM10010532_046350 [Dactylosporangium siamense]|uniref:Uncharacterized protein n=1 Tax=Dactylosporangium siamense TaxID=685454 RepID=A0A919PY80_9ACTN|nr:hypothetical protein Dsi01nite_087440 [Dactylosporangium siamense]
MVARMRSTVPGDASTALTAIPLTVNTIGGASGRARPDRGTGDHNVPPPPRTACASDPAGVVTERITRRFEHLLEINRWRRRYRYCKSRRWRRRAAGNSIDQYLRGGLMHSCTSPPADQ